MSHTVPVSEEDGRDPLLRMRVYRLAIELLEESWADAEKLRVHQATEKVSGQLYAAVGSISATLGEGYSRSSGRDRARVLSTPLAPRERAWFGTGRHDQSSGQSACTNAWINSKRFAVCFWQSSRANVAG